jgi:hypothetical protein
MTQNHTDKIREMAKEAVEQAHELDRERDGEPFAERVRVAVEDVVISEASPSTSLSAIEDAVDEVMSATGYELNR